MCLASRGAGRMLPRASPAFDCEDGDWQARGPACAALSEQRVCFSFTAIPLKPGAAACTLKTQRQAAVDWSQHKDKISHRPNTVSWILLPPSFPPDQGQCLQAWWVFSWPENSNILPVSRIGENKLRQLRLCWCKVPSRHSANPERPLEKILKWCKAWVSNIKSKSVTLRFGDITVVLKQN